MAVDVTATASIDRPRDQVAAYLRDPANDTSWIGGLRSARLLTPGQVTVGSQVERVASFLGAPGPVRQRDHRADRRPAGHAVGALAVPDAGDLRTP